MTGGQSGDDRGPSGREAIDEIGDRLRDLVAGVKAAFRNAEKGASEAADETREGGGSTTIETEKGSVKVEAGWRIKLGGLELSGDAIDALKEKVERAETETRSWRTPHPAARRRRAAQPFRPKARRAPTAPTPAPRAAHVEVFDEIDAVVVTAELPGVAQDDIELRLEGGNLRICATGDRPFEATAELPAGVDPAAKPDMRLANGVLEIRMPKRAGA